MNNDAFIPESYEAPTGGGGFTKLELGDNKMRILSSPLMLWVTWADKVCTRIKYRGVDNKPAKPAVENASVKHAWGLVIWNYQTQKIEVFELDKQAIIGALTTYAKDADWGNPRHYDIVINKSGSGMDTEYKFVAKPAKPLADDAKVAYTECPIDLNQLLVPEGNPFLSNGGAEVQTAAATNVAEAVAKVVTVENWVAGDAVPPNYKIEDGKLVKGLPF